MEYVLSSSSFELCCPVWTKSQSLAMAKRASCSWWCLARCRWVGSSQGISSFVLYQIRHKWNLCSVLGVGALSCGPACAVGNKGVGDLGTSFSHKERRTWFTFFSPPCTEARGPELPPCTILGAALPPRRDLALLPQSCGRQPAQESGLCSGIDTKGMNQEGIVGSGVNYIMRKGFWMLHGWALWRASALPLNPSRSKGKLCPWRWAKT